ncbi:hypothetical protein AB2T90_17185 [Clostridium butyricum]|uniref:hypothetical protein n=1 Tax=Clostridium butyricum TaxID=1492 RepID=UPI003465C84F
MGDKLKKLKEESFEQYVYRIYESKVENNMTCNECKDIINKELEKTCNESYYRGIHKHYKLGFDDGFEKALTDRECKNKIEEVTELIGALDVKKQLVRNDTNKLNKLKRDLIKNVEIANYITEYMDREYNNFTKLNFKSIVNESEKVLIVCISDWHVGYVIKDYKSNSYNYEIAKKRLSKLLSEIEKEIRKNNINKVVVVQCGDITEGTYMRKNQSYECEFNSNEQTVMAEELLYNFVTSISSMKVNVDLYSLSGNHQRGNGDKDANIESDSNNYVIVKNLRKWFELSNNKRVKVCDIDFTENCAEFDLGFGLIKAKHGDTSPKEDKKFYDTECSMNNSNYSLLIKGHYHNFSVTQQNNEGHVLTVGCLFGFNPYSVNRLQCTTGASQSLVVADVNTGIEYIRNINLQIN